MPVNRSWGLLNVKQRILKEEDEALAADITSWRAAKAHHKAQGDRAKVEHRKVDNLVVLLLLGVRAREIGEAAYITRTASEA
ncbi:hypothetical protein P167DRAFT_575043 [Morchella conica CCBAS932]|uniref:Uncharacterized protein n=1 Tax=Morchella conica CCBAS932 TaxID=1392247 RepID=A0A3N4KMN8_9PEZI|nr:hypothetical protein P167DRAFT_575043 [Morchella conica CCBAS932]